MTRSLRGSDQTRGGLSISITNHLDVGVDAWYVENVPWIIRPYLSTLRVESFTPLLDVPTPHEPAAQQTASGARDNNATNPPLLNLQQVRYVPPAASRGQEARTRPTLLEIPLYLPARSTVGIGLEFEKVFLKYTEHPPDAQRGWELPGGVLVPSPVAGEEKAGGGGGGGERKTRLPRVYTAPLLADLATPDFSMPYNVIILSGALIALLFGMTFNMLTRRFVLVKS